MNRPHDSVESSLRAGSGIRPEERPAIVEQFSSLDARLRSFPADAVDLELSVKERDTPSQRTVLEADISGWPRLVATSTHTTILVLARLRRWRQVQRRSEDSGATC